MKKLIQFVLCSFMFGLASCGGENEAKNSEEAAGWYQYEFGAIPTEDILELKAKQRTGRDSVVAWLAFRCNQTTVNTLLARGFTEISDVDFAERTKNANAPRWWVTKEGTKCYKMEKWSKEFDVSTAYVAYNPHDQELIFYHSAF